MELVEVKVLPDDLASTMAAEASHFVTYRILGRIVRIAGNSADILDRLALLHGAFRQEGHAGPADDEIFFRAERNSLTVIGRASSFTGYGDEYLQWPSAVFNRILLGSVRTHVILHAGAVSRNGHGLVIAGNSGMGKSTMVGHLVSRGFGYLSDEFAPVERGAAIVEPFPVRIGLRAGPGQALIGSAASVDVDFAGDRKKLLDADALSANRTSGRVPLRTVIFLTRAPGGAVSTSKKLPGPVSAVFSGWSPALEDETGKLPGAKIVGTRPWRAFTEVLLRVDSLGEIAQPLRDLAARHRVELVQLQYEDYGTHDYDVEPAMTPLSPAAAVIELVKKIPPFCRAALIADVYDGKASRLAEECGALFGDVAFYRLAPGRLDKSLALVEEVAP